MNRAYSVLEIKSIDEDLRIIEGIATTPRPDRLGDVVEPKGASFSLPIPFLWQHKQESPIGHVTSAKVTDKGITVKVQLVSIDEPGELKTLLDRAWQSIHSGLVRGLSVGFKPIGEPERIKGTSGLRFNEWEWLELSAVTIPANVETTITAVKSYDVGAPAATGTATQSKTPGASGTKLIKLKPEDKMIFTERVRDLENTLAAKVAALNEIDTKVAKEGRTKDESEREQFDTLQVEIKSVQAELKDARDLEAINKSQLVVVNGTSSATASASRAPTQHITVKPNVAPGIGFARYAMAMAVTKGNRYEAAEYAKALWPDQPEVGLLCKAAIAAGTTTDAAWAGPLAVVSPLAGEFLELLRPKTLIGRIPGLRKVPFNVSMPAQATGGTYNWTGQGAAKPLSALTFATVTLPFAKATGIIVLTKELVKLSSPSAQEVVRDEMINGMRQFLDTQFIDPAVAISANVSPASITNGVTGTAASGVTEAAARLDLRVLMNLFNTNNFTLDGVVIVTSESIGFTLGTVVNAVGAPAFPGVGAAGGSILGIPVITSNVVGAQIVAIHAPSVLIADDGQTEIDISEQASLQMDSAPANPTTATEVMVSLWQRNLVGLRADRFITWLKARANSVQRIHTVAYT